MGHANGNGVAERLPPHNLEAERAVLGSMLRDNACIEGMREVLGADSFYTDAHQKIYRAVVALHERGGAVDLVLLSDELKSREQINDVGGYGYLGELWGAAPTAANVEHYARAVREREQQRDLIHLATELLRDSYDQVQPAGVLLERAVTRAEEIRELRSSGQLEAEWKPPSPWPEPLAPEAFHGLAGDVVRAIDPGTEADPAAILIQLLTAFGNVIGRSGHYMVGVKAHYPNLYTVVVGQTARARKGTSWSWVRVLFPNDWTDDWSRRCRSGLSTNEGLIRHLRDDPPEGRGDKRLLTVEEEFAAVLRCASRDGNTISSGLRQLWDGDSASTLTRKDPLEVEGAHFSLIGHCTREELTHSLTETDKANGLANRIIWMAAKRSKLIPRSNGALHLGDLESRVCNAVARARRAGRMRWSAEAGRAWDAGYEALTQDRPGLLDLITCRAEAQVVRLSLIYALLDGEDDIGLVHLQAALAVWRYSYASCRWIFGGDDGTGDDDADEILAYLQAAGRKGLTKTEIHRLFNGNRTAKQIDHALGVLVQADLVVPGRNASGGRAAVPWRAKSCVGAKYPTNPQVPC
jgi:hypothetical protein